MNTQIAETAETDEVEGLDPQGDLPWGDYPIDTLLIRNENRTVYEVVRRIRNDQYVMNPDFQRDFIWSEDKQSKLIESVVMRIPLPVFYLAEDDQGRMIVVDGLQRLSTFARFFKDELKLKLSGQKELDGKTFHDLEPKLQNRIEDTNLVLYIIDAKVPERARLDIFERVNGGEKLTRQQMRNCLYMGQATRFLKEEAGTDIFRLATGGSLKSSTMRDREFVNRFCAFKLLTESEYNGDMDDFLAKALVKMHRLPKEELDILSAEFRNSLTNNLAVFGRHAFRKHSPGQEARSVLNAALFDVMSVGLSGIPTALIQQRAPAIKLLFEYLMQLSEFKDAISFGTNDTKKVRMRFGIANGLLKGALNANPT